MGRIRTIKPEFYAHEDLWDAEAALVETRGAGYTGLVRVTYSGLWTQADREGRFKWRPRSLKMAILPYDPVDFGVILECLAGYGFIVRYQIDGESYGWIPSFTRNQAINNRERDSELPEPPEGILDDLPLFQDSNGSATRQPRDNHAGPGEGKGREGKGKEGKGRGAGPSGPLPTNQTLEDDPDLIGPIFPTRPGAKNKATIWRCPIELLRQLIEAYPSVQHDQELAKALVWINTNEQKTADGMGKFLLRWFSRAQDDSRRRPPAGPSQPTKGPRRPPR